MKRFLLTLIALTVSTSLFAIGNVAEKVSDGKVTAKGPAKVGKVGVAGSPAGKAARASQGKTIPQQQNQ